MGSSTSTPTQSWRLNRAILIGTVIIMLVVGAGVSLNWFSKQAQRIPINRLPIDGTPHEIVEGSGLYFLGADHAYSHSASYALDTRDGIIVIDPGLRFSMIEAAFDNLGLRVSAVKIILVTHRHADHWFAARDLVSASGARVLAHEKEIPVMVAAADLGQYYASHHAMIIEVPTLANVEALKDGDTVRLGATAIEVIATPGHTPGSVCYRTEIRGRQVLFSGDTILSLTPSVFNGDYMTRLGSRFGGNIQAYLATMRRLSSVPVDILLPGHPIYGTKLDPFLTRNEWRAMLQPNIDRLERWLEDYPYEVRLFLDGIPKALTDEILYLGEARGTAGYVLKTPGTSLCIDPGSRTVEELTSIMRKLGAELSNLQVVLITSFDSEHAASAPALCSETGAKLFAGPAEHSSQEIAPDRVLLDGQVFQVGDVTVTAFESGVGKMSYLTRVSNRLVLIGGDNMSRFPPRLGESPNVQLNEKFRGLLQRTAVQVLLPAHPQFDESPFYFPGEWAQRVRGL